MTSPQLPPPGWYPDGSGKVRWWTGVEWATEMPPPAPIPPDRTWSILAHLGSLLAPIFGALAIRLIVGKRDPFTHHHAREAMNAEIAFVIIWNALLAPVVIVMFRQVGEAQPPPTALFVAFPVVLLLGLGFTALSARGAYQASKGIWWTYPWPFRLTRKPNTPEPTDLAPDRA